MMGYRDDVLDNVRDQPGLTAVQLATMMGRPKASTRRDLQQLQRDGEVHGVTDGQQTWYPLNWSGPDA